MNTPWLPVPERSPHTGERPVPVLYLDIDGTVREGKDDALGRFVNGPDDVVVFPQAVHRMREWKATTGGRIVGCSNQGGIAMGLVSHAAVIAAMHETQRQADGLFEHICLCPHHPLSDDPEMSNCWCRKPSPGLVIEAATALVKSHPGEIYPPAYGLFVGDRPEDADCARMAGLRFQDAQGWRERGVPA